MPYAPDDPRAIEYPSASVKCTPSAKRELLQFQITLDGLQHRRVPMHDVIAVLLEMTAEQRASLREELERRFRESWRRHSRND